MGIYTYTALLLSLTTLTFSFLLSLQREKSYSDRMDFVSVFIMLHGWYHILEKWEKEAIGGSQQQEDGHAGGSRLCFLWPQQTTSAKH